MIGKKLRYIRNSKKLSLETVKTATGISDSRLSKIERGINEHPSLDDISLLLKFYEIPLVSFLHQEGYCENNDTILKNLELLNDFELQHVQTVIDFILEEKGLKNAL